MANIYLRRSTSSDLNNIMAIIYQAKALLKQDGSPQWQSGTPNREMLSKDIEQKMHWVLIVNGEIAACATLQTFPDPTYRMIQGKWENNTDPYATIHRVAIASQFRGMHLTKYLFSNLITMALVQGFKNIRIDTFRENVRMQGLIKSMGYHYCGLIHIDDPLDDERLAFELNLQYSSMIS